MIGELNSDKNLISSVQCLTKCDYFCANSVTIMIMRLTLSSPGRGTCTELLGLILEGNISISSGSHRTVERYTENMLFKKKTTKHSKTD